MSFAPRPCTAALLLSALWVAAGMVNTDQEPLRLLVNGKPSRGNSLNAGVQRYMVSVQEVTANALGHYVSVSLGSCPFCPSKV